MTLQDVPTKTVGELIAAIFDEAARAGEGKPPEEISRLAVLAIQHWIRTTQVNG